TSGGSLPAPADTGKIMRCVDTQDQLPVIFQLASEFAVCDQWFSSLPGPTWPNRFFAHGASSVGLDPSPSTSQILEWETINGFDFPNQSIFQRMNGFQVPWRIYVDTNGPLAGSIPQVTSLKGIRLTDAKPFSRFALDLQKPNFLGYTFIE